MEVFRSIPLLLPDDQDVRETVLAFGAVRRAASKAGHNNGNPLGAIDLHNAIYGAVKGHVNSQMTITALRSVAGAYATAKKNKVLTNKPLEFKRNTGIFLIGERGRDASFKKDGTLSIWTVSGRKRVNYTIPGPLRYLFDQATKLNYLTIGENKNGGLRAVLTITLEVSETQPGVPVGIDLNETNAVVASHTDGRVFFVTGKRTRVQNAKTRKIVKRLRIKLCDKKAESKSTRSVRRTLKRLSHKRKNRTTDFCRVVAKQLVAWAGQGTTLVFEDLCFDRRKRRRKGINRRLSEWPHAQIKQCVRNKAELVGIAVVEVDPAYTSQTCSSCGNVGCRNRHSFSCPVCGFADHADINAAKNIRKKFTAPALPDSGLPSTSPEARPEPSGTGKPLLAFDFPPLDYSL